MIAAPHLRSKFEAQVIWCMALAVVCESSMPLATAKPVDRMNSETAIREVNFDGLVGPTHNYAGLAIGNKAATAHKGDVSNPREAALQGLAKMNFVASLGVAQAVLPPHPRPSLSTLRQLGFSGSDERVLCEAATWNRGQLLRNCSSAAAMWAANAATTAPSNDTEDGRVHVTPANLQALFHRSIEADVTHDVLRAIFVDERRFTVHRPLPGGGQFGDEGAANHIRLGVPGHRAVHMFAWGRRSISPSKEAAPTTFPARQTYEASRAVARLHRLSTEACLFPQQAPVGIDAGAFHTDVLAVGNGGFLMLHESAFAGAGKLLRDLRTKLGAAFTFALARERDLPLKTAVATYPFNSQILTLLDGSMAIIAPKDCERTAASRKFLERIVRDGSNPVKQVHYVDVRQSMSNGGGPACLRLRLWLTDEERRSVRANVFWNETLFGFLKRWVNKYYRDRLVAADLADPQLARQSLEALDELTGILKIGSVYDFQRAGGAR